MPPPVSNFLRTGQPDARLAQSAGTPFDATARQVLDQQVVDVQTLLALLQANGVLGSYIQVDPASPVDVAKGDVLCRSAYLTRRSAVVATPANLALAGGSVLGVALDAAAKGSRCPYAALGAVPPDVTGIVTIGSPGLARVSPTGRVEGVFSYGTTDTPLGGLDSTGWLTLFPGGVNPQTATGTYRGVAATTDATPTAIVSIPFGDDSIATSEFSAIALTPGVGAFQFFSAGGLTGTVAGVLFTAGAPTTNTLNTYGGGVPAVDAVYDVPTKTLTYRVTGIAATNISWAAVAANVLVLGS